MAKSMSIKLEFVAPLPQIAITRFTYNAVELYGPRGPRYKEVDLYSIRCLLLPTFRSLAAIVSEKSTVFTFSYRKAYVTKFGLAVNWSRSLQGHHLNNL